MTNEQAQIILDEKNKSIKATLEYTVKEKVIAVITNLSGIEIEEGVVNCSLNIHDWKIGNWHFANEDVESCQLLENDKLMVILTDAYFDNCEN